VKFVSVKTGRIRVGARHTRLDKHKRAGALRPDPVLVLSVIAGMAHWTLKSGAATRNSVAFGASTEDPAATGAGAIRPKDHGPIIV
jgi:hypothetical protein